MGLDNLLATLEKCDSVTPVTPCYKEEVTAKAPPIKACTLVTSVTPERTIRQSKAEILNELQRAARRQKIISMLEAEPGTPRAIYTETDSDPHNVILTVAVRACNQTCELLIPKANMTRGDCWN